MGFDTTPAWDDRDPGGPDSAPRWFLFLLIILITVGALWFLWTFFNVSGPA